MRLVVFAAIGILATCNLIRCIVNADSQVNGNVNGRNIYSLYYNGERIGYSYTFSSSPSVAVASPFSFQAANGGVFSMSCANTNTASTGAMALYYIFLGTRYGTTSSTALMRCVGIATAPDSLAFQLPYFGERWNNAFVTATTASAGSTGTGFVTSDYYFWGGTSATGANQANAYCRVQLGAGYATRPFECDGTFGCFGAPLLPYGLGFGDAWVGGPSISGTGASRGRDISWFFDTSFSGVSGASIVWPAFGGSYTGFYVNQNGLITFGGARAQWPSCTPPCLSVPGIAVYWSAVDTSSRNDTSGVVLVRTAFDNTTISNCTNAVRTGYLGQSNFTARYCAVVTWDHVGYRPNRTDAFQTFQLALAVDGTGKMFAILNYGNEPVQWNTAAGESIYPVIAFDSGSGNGANARVLSMSGSATRTKAMNLESNTRPVTIPGRLVYRVDIPDVREPPLVLSSDCSLRSITVSPNSILAPAFRSDIVSYSLLALRGVAVWVNATYPSIDALMYIDRVYARNGSSSVTRALLTNSQVNITVVASDGTMRLYAVSLTIVSRCQSGPCANGGTCTDVTIELFTCSCAVGFSGIFCQTNINECASQPCRNGGVCVDEANGWSCTCPGGYIGSTCLSDVNECASQPCANGGTCTDHVNSFTCDCVTGYFGARCQTETNDCASAPCANGGTCVDLINALTCRCASGYSGTFCQTDIDECASLPCANAGTCIDGPNRFTCACPAGYSGLKCQTEVNECASQPCASGGTCTDGIGQFTCACASGFSGLTCETNVNECSSLPCQNGGTCIDRTDAFTCACAFGYLGSACQTDVNECSSQPCANAGTCTDQVNSFTCECAVGWTGGGCQTSINECASQPCGNGGTCVDGTNEFVCHCAAGYTGLFCQTDADECASLPCVNAGTCVDGPNRFTCACALGLSGLLCQTNVNECTSNPCVYGTCLDRVGLYNCSCVNGIDGVNCDTDINECATDNGGCGVTSTCINSFQTYNCSASLVPGSLSSPEPVMSAQPLVFNSLRGQVIEFAISFLNSAFSSFSVTAGTIANPTKYVCQGLTAIGAQNGVIQLSQCRLPAGAGGGYFLFLHQFNSVVSRSAANDTVSYPPPRISAGTLRQNRTGYSFDPVPTALALDTSAPVNVAFDGFNFDPTQTAVTYGRLPGADQYTCTVIVAWSSNHILSCMTAQSSQGSNLYFRVRVTGETDQTEQTDVSTFTVAFPDKPFIYRVSGCTDAGNSTIECPTEGGNLLSVFGANFVQNNIAVSVGGRSCTLPIVDPLSDGRTMTCLLPQSTGGQRNMIITSIGQNSDSAPFIIYALPVIHSIAGCNQTTEPNAIAACPTRGQTGITLRGIDFGDELAVILVGNSLCQSVRHDAVEPHRVVTCMIPAGTGLSRPVLLLQSGGGIGSNISLSYAECQAGQYVVGLDCSSCALGQFSSISSSQTCIDCAAGKYTNVDAGASFCFSCSPGRISTAGQSTCVNCTLGSFVSAEAQGGCLPCSPGRFAAANGSSICDDCSAGRAQPAASASTCLACDTGKATSSSGQSACTPCNAGSYRDSTTAASICTPCPIGTSQAAPGSSACFQCVKGTFSGTGAESCTGCPYGTMAPDAGSTTCRACPDQSVSATGNTLCDCAIGYYSTQPNVDMICLACPGGAVCNRAGMLFTQLIAADDWWRADNESLSFFRCLQSGQCVAGGCASNRVGAICAVCASGFSQNANGLDCTPCPASQSTSIGATVGYTILILAAVFVVFYVVWRSEPARTTPESPNLIIKAFTPEDRAPPNYAYNFKIILSYLQIATTVLGLVEIPWPTAFQQFMSYFSFVRLDFIPWGSVQCVATLNFYVKLVVLFIVPIVVLLLVGLVPLLALALENRVDYSDDPTERVRRSESRHKIIKLLAFALFMMYPAISQQVLSFFICRSVDGNSYLVADFTLKCGDAEWNRYLPLAIVAVFIYPIGIPVLLFGALYRVRHRLHTPAVKLAYGLAYEAYLYVYWWWEMVDMLAKLFLTSLLGFFPSDVQCQIGMAVCIGYLLLVVLSAPYIRRIDDRMCCTCMIHLFLILLVGATLQQSPFIPGSTTDKLASAIMFIVLIALVALIVVHAVIFVRKYVRSVQRQKLNRNAESTVDNPMATPAAGSATVIHTGDNPSGGSRDSGGSVAGAELLHAVTSSQTGGGGGDGGEWTIPPHQRAANERRHTQESGSVSASASASAGGVELTAPAPQPLQPPQSPQSPHTLPPSTFGVPLSMLCPVSAPAASSREPKLI